MSKLLGEVVEVEELEAVMLPVVRIAGFMDTIGFREVQRLEVRRSIQLEVLPVQLLELDVL